MIIICKHRIFVDKTHIWRAFPKPRTERRKMDNCKMYVEYIDEKPVAYRYGEEWVQQQLLMEGGYKTPEEAIEAWRAENG